MGDLKLDFFDNFQMIFHYFTLLVTGLLMGHTPWTSGGSGHSPSRCSAPAHPYVTQTVGGE